MLTLSGDMTFPLSSSPMAKKKSKTISLLDASGLYSSEAVEWIGLDELEGDLENQPGKYAYWFKQAISRVIGYKKRGSME